MDRGLPSGDLSFLFTFGNLYFSSSKFRNVSSVTELTNPIESKNQILSFRLCLVNVVFTL